VIATRTEQEVAVLRKANQIVADVLVELKAAVEPGITTGALDALAEERIRQNGGVPSFLGYHGYPNATCISVDDAIVHGIPDGRVLKEGELVSIDVGVLLQGYHGDAAITVACGPVDALRQRLMDTTERSLARAVAAARAGNDIEDVSRAVQETVEAGGFTVVLCFVGHGIGAQLHEEPQIPNYVTGKRSPVLRPGMVLAIEPMVNAGTSDVRVLDDGWTAVTADGQPSAHFEHSIVVRDGEPEILSVPAGRAEAPKGQSSPVKRREMSAAE
jgi:methionyl aminopeptidase